MNTELDPFGLCFCGVWELMSPLLEMQLAVAQNLSSTAALLSCWYISFISCNPVWTLAQFSVCIHSHSFWRHGGAKVSPYTKSNQSASPINPNAFVFNMAATFRIAIKQKTWQKFLSGSAPEENNPLWSQHLCRSSPAPCHGSSQIFSARASNRGGMFSLFIHQGFLPASVHFKFHPLKGIGRVGFLINPVADADRDRRWPKNNRSLQELWTT